MQDYSSFSDRCALCGKESGNHKGGTSACPVGLKHRTIGYTSFSHTQVFVAKPNAGKVKPLKFQI